MKPDTSWLYGQTIGTETSGILGPYTPDVIDWSCRNQTFPGVNRVTKHLNPYS
jgi:hypothetical protein